MSALETAKHVIDAHADAVEKMILSAESFSEHNARALSTMSSLLSSQVEAMASVEGAIHRILTRDELQTAKDYAETKLASLRERAFRELPKFGLNSTFTPIDIASINSLVTMRANATGDTRYSYASGFIVCHRKCCQNDAGNGVAVGVGCYDCDDHVVSESCPPV